MALKVAFPELVQEYGRSALEHEARIASRLSHPNIAGIYGHEEAEGKRFLVMELIAGEELSDRIARGPIPVDEALVIANNSAGTDGIDGNTPCAGAMVTGDTAATARQMGFDIGAELRAANSGSVLMATGDLFRPGATNTNVMDLVIAIVGER